MDDDPDQQCNQGRTGNQIITCMVMVLVAIKATIKFIM